MIYLHHLFMIMITTDAYTEDLFPVIYIPTYKAPTPLIEICQTGNRFLLTCYLVNNLGVISL